MKYGQLCICKTEYHFDDIPKLEVDQAKAKIKITAIISNLEPFQPVVFTSNVEPK